MWQSFVQQWLRHKVREAAIGHVSQAAGAARGELDEPLGPCDVGLVFALAIESSPLEARFKAHVAIRGRGFSLRLGRRGERSLAIVRSGIGRKAAARATEALITGHRPAWILSAGFAGALASQVKRGDIVMANSLCTLGGERLSLDLKIDPAQLTGRQGLHVGRLLTVDRIVAKAEDKQRLAQEHDALAVDMETWAVAQVCRENRVRFLSVRAISDAADEDVPREVARLARQKTAARKAGFLAGSLWRRPGSAKDLWRLKEQADDAAGRLATFLLGVIEQLPTPQRDEDSTPAI